MRANQAHRRYDPGLRTCGLLVQNCEKLQIQYSTAGKHPFANCKEHTAPHTQHFHACGSRLSRMFKVKQRMCRLEKELFIIFAHHVTFALVVDLQHYVPTFPVLPRFLSLCLTHLMVMKHPSNPRTAGLFVRLAIQSPLTRTAEGNPSLLARDKLSRTVGCKWKASDDTKVTVPSRTSVPPVSWAQRVWGSWGNDHYDGKYISFKLNDNKAMLRTQLSGENEVEVLATVSRCWADFENAAQQFEQAARDQVENMQLLQPRLNQWRALSRTT